MSTRTLATAVVSTFVALLYLACGGGDAAPPSPTSTLAVVPAITPSVPPTEPALPAFLQGAEVIQLHIGPEIEFPEDMALIVETGCTQCDGPTTGLTRVYRDPAGTVRTEPLFSFEKLSLGPRTIMTDKGPQDVPALITGFAVTPDASEMIVAVCTQGLCPDLGPAGGGG